MPKFEQGAKTPEVDCSILRWKVVDHGVGNMTVTAMCMVFVSCVSRFVLAVTEMGWRGLSAKEFIQGLSGPRDCE